MKKQIQMFYTGREYDDKWLEIIVWSTTTTHTPDTNTYTANNHQQQWHPTTFIQPIIIINPTQLQTIQFQTINQHKTYGGNNTKKTKWHGATIDIQYIQIHTWRLDKKKKYNKQMATRHGPKTLTIIIIIIMMIIAIIIIRSIMITTKNSLVYKFIITGATTWTITTITNDDVYICVK